jgi:hypothetical protein
MKSPEISKKQQNEKQSTDIPKFRNLETNEHQVMPCFTFTSLMSRNDSEFIDLYYNITFISYF